MNTAPPTESAWRLRADLTTAKVLIWAASVGRDAALTPETHFYLADRYDRLSHIYRAGASRQGAPLVADCGRHYRAGGLERSAVCRGNGHATSVALGEHRCLRARRIEDHE